MKFETLKPNEIEKRSFEMITEELGEINVPIEQQSILKRVIHTTADFEYLNTLYFSENVVQKAHDALKAGATVVTDTQMAYSGINKTMLAQLGGKAVCFMSDSDVAEEAKSRGVTRATVSMEKAAKIDGPVIFAIGNAPTALIRIDELIEENKLNPALVVGVPVGFVNVVESKELFVGTKTPSIIARGRKGGSNVAASIINALLYQIIKREGF